MKIIVFGATGRTGQLVVRQSLEKGYQVVAFTRSPQKLALDGADLAIFEGDIQDAPQVSAAIEGTDAVISTLGPRDNRQQYVITSGMENILLGMKQHGVSRLIMTTGAGVGDPNDKPGLFDKLMNLLLGIISRNVYLDMAKTSELVRKSDVDWTIVRAPMLTDGPESGEIKAAWVGKGLGMRISRKDLASFIVAQLNDGIYLHQAPAVSN